MKKIFLSLVLMVPAIAYSMEGIETLYIDNGSLSHREDMGKLWIKRDNQGYAVVKDGQEVLVNSYDTDPILRKLNPAQLAKAMLLSKIRVTQYDNNDYKLELAQGLKGGGGAGATAGVYIGRGVWYFLCYGTIGIVAACTGPAAGVTFTALSATFAAPIEAGATVASIAGGIAGGVATGPV